MVAASPASHGTGKQPLYLQIASLSLAMTALRASGAFASNLLRIDLFYFGFDLSFEELHL
jgi:hypothetical protein